MFLFIKTREQKNMFYLLRQENRRTCFLLRQENMRTRGEGEGLIEQKENVRLGWALPNTRCLRYPHLNHWILHSSFFTLHLNHWIFHSSLFTLHLNHWILHSSFFTLHLNHWIFHFSLFTSTTVRPTTSQSSPPLLWTAI